MYAFFVSAMLLFVGARVAQIMDKNTHLKENENGG
jgi:hypothetical protein